MINGDRLKKLRQNKGLTQEELGNILGITKASVCCYEKETRSPSLENLLDLMEFFGVGADFLLGTDEIVTMTAEAPKDYIHMTSEEIKFVLELRKNKYLSTVLLEDPLRGIELLNKKIG